MSRNALALLGACVLAWGAAHGAELSQVGPLAKSSAIISARPLMKEPGFETAITVTGANAPPVKAPAARTPGKKPAPAAPSITLDVAADFTVAYRDMTGIVYDYALRRVIALDDTKHRIHSVSMYALADFEVRESDYRRGIRQTLDASLAHPASQSGGAPLNAQIHVLDTETGTISPVIVPSRSAAAIDPFWTQSELHVVNADDDTPAIVRRKAKDGSLHFLYAGKEVAAFTPSKQALTKEQSAGLARYLRAATSLHPSIVDAIAASGKLPSRISFSRPPLLNKPPVVWTFKPSVTVNAVYPLRPGLLPDSVADEAGADTVLGLLPVIQDAVAGNAPGRKSVDDYRAAIDAAMKDDKYFQAYLLALEMGLQYGKQDCAGKSDCRELKDVLAPGAGDARVAAMKEALAPTGDRSRSDILDGVKHDDVSDGYVVDEVRASFMAVPHPDQALPLFAAAIQANPYAGGFYRDLGNFFQAHSEPDLAWFCYDVERIVAAGANAPGIKDVDAREAQLAQDHPELF